MDRFQELADRVAAAATRVAELMKAGKSCGFQKQGAREAVAELDKLVPRLERCISADVVTEQFLEATLAQCDATIAAVMPILGETGRPN